MLSAADRLPYRPSRVVVGGASGSGKTTLAGLLAAMIGAAHTEIDSLHHGPGWTARPEFIADVAVLAAGQRWVTEYQYPAVRPLLLARADLVVYLLLPRWLVMSRVVRRSIVDQSGGRCCGTATSSRRCGPSSPTPNMLCAPRGEAIPATHPVSRRYRRRDPTFPSSS
jgi:hypothetical protein